MANIVFKNVTKTYPPMTKKEKSVQAVKDFNLEVKDKEFVVFVGPSGCGKSTTLRMLAGLEDISGGEIFIDGRLINNVKPKDRDIAMVFQNYALYPHMTVFDNMAFSLKLKHVPKNEVRERVYKAAEILNITALLDRKPKALSGGQRQRVALGRAIVREPVAFLMDEPLSNLDAKLRVQMRTEITKLHRELDATVIYVTHDQVEAMTMGTRIVVMKDGVIQQIAAPTVLYNYPENMFVASFIGSPSMNFFSAVPVRRGEDMFLEFSAGSVALPADKTQKLAEGGYEGKNVIFGIRPEHLKLVDGQDGGFERDSFGATASLVEQLGAEDIIYFMFGDTQYAAKAVGSDVKAGDSVTLRMDMDKMHIFDAETTRTITN